MWTEVWKEGSRLKTGHDRPAQSVGWTEAGRSLFCARCSWLQGRDPAHCPVSGGAGRAVLALKVQEGVWRLGPRRRDSPGEEIRQKEEAVSAFGAAGVYLCVCRLIEFYLRLDSAEGSPQMQTPC